MKPSVHLTRTDDGPFQTILRVPNGNELDVVFFGEGPTEAAARADAKAKACAFFRAALDALEAFR